MSEDRQLTIEGGEVPHGKVVQDSKYFVLLPAPGEECPRCKRRIPYPKKESSPQTKTSSYRIPIDDAETHEEILEAAAKHLGIHGSPHWRWQLHTLGAARLLQDSPPEPS